eukprot:358579-Chlamydomonas_euryale.AAC.4
MPRQRACPPPSPTAAGAVPICSDLSPPSWQCRVTCTLVPPPPSPPVPGLAMPCQHACAVSYSEQQRRREPIPMPSPCPAGVGWAALPKLTDLPHPPPTSRCCASALRLAVAAPCSASVRVCARVGRIRVCASLTRGTAGAPC